MSEPERMEVQQINPTSLVARMAQRFGVEPARMLATLKATAFRGEVTNEQMMALLIVAEQYRLNPWVREIYAFPDKNNGIVPVVGVDGWLRILNEHPAFDGVEFNDGPSKDGGLPEWIECRIFRKDRTHATVAREYMAECKRGTAPWSSHPRRMLRHKSLIQAARIAMSFGGIYDQDEAERIIEGERLPNEQQRPAALTDLNADIAGAQRRQPVDVGSVVGDAPAEATAAREAAGKSTAAMEAAGYSASVPFASYPATREAIERAKTADDVYAAQDLVRNCAPQFRAELNDLCAARLAAIEPGAP